MRQAAVMLIVKDGRILAVSRRYDKTKFGLPGGKCEENETAEQAAIRETFEETGVTVSKCTHIFTREEMRDRPEGEDFYTFCYYAEEWSGNAHDSEEGHVEWLTEAELTGAKGAFGDYNTKTLTVFKSKYPEVFIEPPVELVQRAFGAFAPPDAEWMMGKTLEEIEEVRNKKDK